MSKNNFTVTIDCENFGDFREKAFKILESEFDEVEKESGYLHNSQYDYEIKEKP